uniref:Envelope protein n=1 Tax=Chionoecetes opilio bacilliform virus TaxID=1825681 RepID=A0A1Q3DL82_9VIRU|nr:envelope protein [Chionoecetes opilio bacilliform virus]
MASLANLSYAGRPGVDPQPKTYSTGDLVDSLNGVRLGLFLILVLAFAAMLVFLFNILWGAGTNLAGSTAETGEKYTNQMRDYVGIIFTAVIIVVTVPCIYKTYP